MARMLIKSRYVAPMAGGPVLRDHAVLVDGERIAAIGPADDLLAIHRDAMPIDLKSALLLPGLINAHTHLELSGLRRGRYTGDFCDWLRSIRPRLAPDRSDFAQRLTAALQVGVEQSLAAGVTCVGDISAFFADTRPLLRVGQLRVLSFGEALGIGSMRDTFASAITAAADTSMQTDRLRVGLSPHAPYTVDEPGYKESLWLSRNNALPLCTHLAEHEAERPLLEERIGDFVDLWKHLGVWSADLPLLRESPVRAMKSAGLVDHPTLLAHVNHLDDAELALLAGGRASVVFCPRTHQWFGHPPHRWREMLAAGVNVCVGTDSLASAPSLDVLDDLRLLRSQVPDVSPLALLEMVTARAARAVQWFDQLGTIEAGKLADLVAFPVATADPLTELLTVRRSPSVVWIGGEVVRGG